MRAAAIAILLLLYGCVSAPAAPKNDTAELDECLRACNDSFTPNGYVTCKASCFTNDAEEHLEASRCEAINRMEEFKAIGTNSSFWFVTCVGNVAVRKKDAFACSRIPPGADRDVCIAGVADSLGEPSLCGAVSDQMVREACVADASD